MSGTEQATLDVDGSAAARERRDAGLQQVENALRDMQARLPGLVAIVREARGADPMSEED